MLFQFLVEFFFKPFVPSMKWHFLWTYFLEKFFWLYFIKIFGVSLIFCMDHPVSQDCQHKIFLLGISSETEFINLSVPLFFSCLFRCRIPGTQPLLLKRRCCNRYLLSPRIICLLIILRTFNWLSINFHIDLFVLDIVIIYTVITIGSIFLICI